MVHPGESMSNDELSEFHFLEWKGSRTVKAFHRHTMQIFLRWDALFGAIRIGYYEHVTDAGCLF